MLSTRSRRRESSSARKKKGGKKGVIWRVFICMDEGGRERDIFIIIGYRETNVLETCV